MARCCTSCFRDPVLRAQIEMEGNSGECDFCAETSRLVVAVGKLAGHFKKLLDLYEVIPAPPVLFKTERAADFDPIPSPEEILNTATPEEIAAWRSRSRSGRDLRLYPPRNTWHWWETESSKTLIALFTENWDVFSHRISDEERGRLLRLIVEEAGLDSKTAGDDWHWVTKDDAAVGKDYEFQWGRYRDDLRSRRRFIPESGPSLSDMKAVITAGLPLVERVVDEGEVAYRARMKYVERSAETFSIDRPLSADAMGAPPARMTASGGRLNPPGIAFLYLALDESTAVAENRPLKGDSISMVKFETTRALRIADFTQLRELDSAFGHEDLVEEVEMRRLLHVLSGELAQPVDQTIAPIEYVPMQYLAEVILDAGFDGISYWSAVGPGDNLVLFRPEDAQSVDGSEELLRVTNVEYTLERDRSAEANELFKRVYNLVGDSKEE